MGVAAEAGARTTVADLVARLEAGVAEVASSDGWRNYLAAQARFHTYSLGNVLLILGQMPTATRVAGFHTWLSLGRHVRRGERGIRILAPVAIRQPPSESADSEEVAEARTVTRFRIVSVFDVSQTDGDPLPQHPCRTLTTDSDRGAWLYARLRAIAAVEGIDVKEDMRGLGSAHGVFVPGVNAIGLAPGLSADQRAKTMAHELAHAMLHHGGDRTREEAEAEAEGVAFVVSAWAGLDTSSYSFAYVADWSAREDAAGLVRRVGATIQKTAAAIIARLDPPGERANPKPA